MDAFIYLSLGMSVMAFIFGICAFNEVAAVRSEMQRKAKEEKK